jgi:two-component system response regulator AdeR
MFRREPRPEPPPPRQARNITILLVEDDPADTGLILNVLKRHSQVAAVSAADAPDIALIQLESGHLRPDLILLDIHMPRINGFQFLERLRRIKAMATTPVVFLTTSCRVTDVMEARRGSASFYVVKPDTYGELQERLDAVVKRAVSGAWGK